MDSIPSHNRKRKKKLTVFLGLEAKSRDRKKTVNILFCLFSFIPLLIYFCCLWNASFFACFLNFSFNILLKNFSKIVPGCFSPVVTFYSLIFVITFKVLLFCEYLNCFLLDLEYIVDVDLNHEG